MYMFLRHRLGHMQMNAVLFCSNLHHFRKIQSTSLDGHFFGQNINIVYNGLCNKNLNNFEYLFLRIQEKLSICLKQRWRGMAQHCVVIHIYIFQIGPVKIRLLCQNIAQLVSYICQLIIQVPSTVKYLYYHPPQPIVQVNCPVF